MKQREQILRVICAKEDLDAGFDFAELARATDGFSGSDLRNLCVAAAYVPIREVLDAERARGCVVLCARAALCLIACARRLDPHQRSHPEAPTVALRALRMADFVSARQTVSISVSEDAASVAELRAWNDVYGENGSRKPAPLPYYM